MLSNFFFPTENRTVYEIFVKKKYGRSSQATDDNKIRRMRFVRWITKATYTYSEYVVLIPALCVLDN
jgi:hypothetical protein